MFDSFRPTKKPEKELEQIEDDLSGLSLTSEELRLQAADVAMRIGASTNATTVKQAKKAREAYDAVREKIRVLRERRRELLARQWEDTPAEVAVHIVPIPQALADVQRSLEMARADRDALVRKRSAQTDGRAARDLADQISEAEARIVSLRIERETHLGPYNAKVRAALQPVVLSAAKELLVASEAFQAAMSALHGALVLEPVRKPGEPLTLDALAAIDTRPITAGAKIAAHLIDQWGAL